MNVQQFLIFAAINVSIFLSTNGYTLPCNKEPCNDSLSGDQMNTTTVCTGCQDSDGLENNQPQTDGNKSKHDVIEEQKNLTDTRRHNINHDVERHSLSALMNITMSNTSTNESHDYNPHDLDKYNQSHTSFNESRYYDKLNQNSQLNKRKQTSRFGFDVTYENMRSPFNIKHISAIIVMLIIVVLSLIIYRIKQESSHYIDTILSTFQRHFVNIYQHLFHKFRYRYIHQHDPGAITI